MPSSFPLKLDNCSIGAGVAVRIFQVQVGLRGIPFASTLPDGQAPCLLDTDRQE